MSEQNTEQAAEESLLAAIMAPDEQLLDAPGLDEHEDLDETKDEAEADEGEEEQKPDAKAKAQTEAEPEDDEVEIPVENGEPIKRKLSEVVADAQAYSKFKGQEAELLQRTDREYAAAAQQEYKQVRQFSLETGALIQATMQLLREPQPPQPPNPALMNQDYARWEQENAAFHQAQWQYAQSKQLFDTAKQHGNQLLERAQLAQARAEEERDTLAMGQLERKGGWFAEFARDNPKDPNGVRAKFANEMKAAYGYSWDELDAVLTDHRNVEVAKDALAYRAMKASSGEVKAKVEAKAPKLTRTKTEAKSGGAQARDSKGQYVSGALDNLRKTNSDDAAASYFTGLIKAGRI